MALNLGESEKAPFPGLFLPGATFPLDDEGLWGWSPRWAKPRAPHLPALPKEAEQGPWEGGGEEPLISGQPSPTLQGREGETDHPAPSCFAQKGYFL